MKICWSFVDILFQCLDNCLIYIPIDILCEYNDIKSESVYWIPYLYVFGYNFELIPEKPKNYNI